jgi:hypothetical protein
LKRIKGYLEKITQKSKPNLKMDKSASKRMVQHALIQPKNVEKRKEALLQNDTGMIIQEKK